jgi:DNA-binding NarL/FixJ family response regulator
MKPLRILLADDHEIVRRGLISLLKSRAGWEVCGEAQDGRQAVEKVKALRPDVVILDLGMPNLNGLEATRQILRDNAQAKVLVLTITDADEVVRAVLDAGARGFVLKSDAARDLVAAVEALQSDKTFFTSRVADLVLGGFLGRLQPAPDADVTSPALTPREREIVQLLAEGKSSKEVACLLNLSVKTAETHRSNIMRKLNLHSVSGLVLYAVRNNMVQVAVPPLDAPQSTKVI